MNQVLKVIPYLRNNFICFYALGMSLTFKSHFKEVVFIVVVIVVVFVVVVVV